MTAYEFFIVQIAQYKDMESQRNTIVYILGAVLCAMFIIVDSALFADITSVTLTPATPTTLSNGKSYYVAGKQYPFRVRAVDPEAVQDTDWDQIILEFREGGVTRASCTININAGSDSVAAQSGVVVDTIDRSGTSNWSNLDYNITLRFRWDVTDYNAAAVNNIRATVSEDRAPASNMTDTVTFNYGVCASIAVRNFAQDGVAADGRINPWHSAFNVTGSIVYYVAGESITNLVETVDAGEITGTTLRLDGIDTAFGDNYLGGAVTYNITAGFVNVLGDHTWSVTVVMSTPGGPEIAVNTLNFNVNRVEITNIQIINGGGINAPYYRSVYIPGTQIRITARLEHNSPSLGGDRSMRGNTIITVRNVTNGINFTVQISSGQTIGIADVTTPAAADVGDGTTQLTDYQIFEIDAGSYENGQNGPGRILTPNDGGTITNTPVDVQIYWDDQDPPGNNDAPGIGKTPFTTWSSITSTPTSFTINFTPVSALPDPPYDADFYSYRLYYKRAVDPGWTMVDRNVAGYAALSNPATSSISITGLIPLTEYHYFLTAVDVFGIEVEYLLPNTDALYDMLTEDNDGTYIYGKISTTPTSIEVSITDGITKYGNNDFESSGVINAANRPLRKTAIRVELFIITAGDQPDAVNLIVAQDDGTGTGSPTGNIVPLGTVPYERIQCQKTGPNRWMGYIPSENQFMTVGSYVRFIIESMRNGVPSYSDRVEEASPPGDPNAYEYTFAVVNPPQFTPWPTRILNNVIDDKNPTCYPAYYLTDDAYVEITVYDIKGRPVAKLLDNAFRKGGQNIKEGGWNGTNKANRKLGVGLYYIHIRAKRVSDGKVILNSFQKVVIAK